MNGYGIKGDETNTAFIVASFRDVTRPVELAQHRHAKPLLACLRCEDDSSNLEERHWNFPLH